MSKRVVTEAEFERMADNMIQRRLASDRIYQHAATAEQQAKREREVERRAIRDLEAIYEVKR